ncbi:hypothetical protein MJG53_009045 [Ovis ammon polii x Ovis aries]|uniref:Uncharacterized protein n=1 Tax=Ovis ammon polii x Ovis aries TaxID=2918886 RepID=A0ACB9UYA2_9CETA|nr:hypothetical protein MJG53_009045 [Ovis ammon polii x Ovis aries]
MLSSPELSAASMKIISDKENHHSRLKTFVGYTLPILFVLTLMLPLLGKEEQGSLQQELFDSSDTTLGLFTGLGEVSRSWAMKGLGQTTLTFGEKTTSEREMYVAASISYSESDSCPGLPYLRPSLCMEETKRYKTVLIPRSRQLTWGKLMNQITRYYEAAFLIEEKEYDDARNIKRKKDPKLNSALNRHTVNADGSPTVDWRHACHRIGFFSIHLEIQD